MFNFIYFSHFLLTNEYMYPSSGMGGMDFGRNDMQMNQGFGNSFGTMGMCWFIPDYLTIIPSSPITVVAYIIVGILAVYSN